MTENKTTTVANQLLELICARGIDKFLGIPGGAIGPFYDALKEKEIEPINVRHETNAAFMCAGMWAANKQVGCVAVTSGPGVTNVITGLASAKLDKIPMLLVVGEVPTHKYSKGALQEGSSYGLNVKGMLSSVTKEVFEVRNPLTLATDMKRLFDSMYEEGNMGPIAIILPLDVAMQKASQKKVLNLIFDDGNDGYFDGFYELNTDDDPDYSEEQKAILNGLIKSKSTIIVLGSEFKETSRRLTVQHKLSGFARNINAMIITSPRAKGLWFDGNILLGTFGYGGQESVVTYLEANPPEVVLFLGADLDEVSTNNWSKTLVPDSALVIQVTKNLNETSKNYKVDYLFNQDFSSFIEWLQNKLRIEQQFPIGVKNFPVEVSEPEMIYSSKHPVSFIRKMQRIFPEDTIWCSDIGEHFLFAVNELKMNGKNDFIAATAFGSMGSGIGNAIGAALACPDRKVVCFCGDYGFQMYGMDFITAVEQEVKNLTFVILNDARMAMVDNGQNKVFGRSTELNGIALDFWMLPRVVPCVESYEFEHAERFADERLIEDIKKQKTVFLFDAKIDKTAQFTNNNRVSTLSNFGKEEKE